MKLKYNSLIMIGLIFLLSCNDDESTPNFLKEENLSIILDGVTYDIKHGEDYEESGEYNASLSASYDPTELKLTLWVFNTTLPGLEYIKFTADVAAMYYNEDLEFVTNEAVQDGELKLNHETKPSYVYIDMKTDSRTYMSSIQGKYKSYEEGLIYETYKINVDEDDATLVLTGLYSNGVEKVVDGVRDYPNEMFSGYVSAPFTDSDGNSHTLTLDFDIQGEDVVKGGEIEESTQECPVGKYRYNVCGSYYQYLILNGDGTGESKIEDCTGQCTASNYFTWTDSGDKINYMFTGTDNTCGAAVDKPSDTSNSYECVDGGIEISGYFFEEY